MLENRRRAFADLVSIDAWHQPFSARRGTADLHADVVFGTARVGGEIESPVRFRLSIKRAEVVVIIPEAEPVAIRKASVSRDAPSATGKITRSVEKTRNRRAKGGIGASISARGISGSLEAGGIADASATFQERVESSSDLCFFSITQSQNAERFYRWIVERAAESLDRTAANKLDGRPWDATKQPRLTLVDKRIDRTKGLEPTVRLEVRCRREDLLIESIEIKRPTMWETIKHLSGAQNKVAAAESYIRTRLTEEGLQADNIEDKFGQLTLSSVVAVPQQDDYR